MSKTGVNIKNIPLHLEEWEYPPFIVAEDLQSTLLTHRVNTRCEESCVWLYHLVVCTAQSKHMQCTINLAS